jgi:hypothetical protein
MSKLTQTEMTDLRYAINAALSVEPQAPRCVVIHSNWGADDIAFATIVFNEVHDSRDHDKRIYFGAMLCVAGLFPKQARAGAGRTEIVEEFVYLCSVAPENAPGFGNTVESFRSTPGEHSRTFTVLVGK